MSTIIIVIIIGVVIFLLMGGFTPTLVTTEMIEAQRLNADQWHCEQVVWPQAPVIKSGNFTGTLQLSCDFQAVGNNGGLIGLRKYMIEKIPVVVAEAHESNVLNYEGIPAVSYDVKMQAKSKNDSGEVYGKTYIATDGFRQLRNVFVSDRVEGKGYAKLLKSVTSEVRVEPMSKKDWYHLTYLHSSEIEKPGFIFSGMFRNEVQKKMEQETQDKAEAIVTNLSNHL